MMHLEERRLSVDIEKAPLKRVLAHLSKERGIRYSLSPSMAQKRISAQFESLPLKVGIERLLSEMNYSLVFDRRGRLTALYIFGKTDPSLRGRTRIRKSPVSRRTLGRRRIRR